MNSSHAPTQEPLIGPQNVAAAKALESVAEVLGRLRFGQVQLTIHDGKVVQLDVTERTRFS